MTPGERFKNWIDGLSEAWKDKLRGWALRTISEGVKQFLEADEPEAIDNVGDMIARLRANPNTPPEVLAQLKRIEGGSSWFMIVIVIIMAVQMLIQTTSTLWVPTQKQMSHVEERAAQTFRLDPAAVITAWRRDKPTYLKYFDDLRDLGWSDDRIEALKFFTLFYPAPADLIRWQAREVFEPEMIKRYGLDSEFEAIEKEPFYKAGMTDEQILNYWRAHWEHASWQQVVEMLHRGLMDEDEVWDWFRVVEIPPFWRQKLIDSAYTWPTRVDVRRWWDMRTIDEAELRRLYSGMGYRGDNLDNYMLWTKVYTAFPDLIARWKNGWITIDDVKRELTGLGMPAARVEEMIQTKIKTVGPERVAKERDLTKTDIVKGVKNDVISWSEGVELLVDLGYSEDEADYILKINIEALTGSPANMQEFKDITQRYRKAVGLPSQPVSAELMARAGELVKLTGEVKALAEAVEAEKKTLIDADTLPEEATKKRDELQVALHRAEAELFRVRTDYNALVAQWRQTEVK